MHESTKILEKGDIYFMYRPRLEEGEPHHLEEIQRFYFVLKGRENPFYRLVIVGKKRMPSIEHRDIEFAFIDSVIEEKESLIKVLQGKTYSTKTRGGLRTQESCRPLGEGKYLIIQDGHNTHLMYALKRPDVLGRVQKDFGLAKEANMILVLKNPRIASEKGLSSEQKAHYPSELQKHFGDHRFISLFPIDCVNYPGAELLLISEKSHLDEKVHIDIAKQFSTFPHIDMEKQLQFEEHEFPTKPLYEGIWA